MSLTHQSLETKISQSNEQQKVNMFNAAQHKGSLIFAFFCGFNISIKQWTGVS